MKNYCMRIGTVIDVVNERELKNQIIMVENECITSIANYSEAFDGKIDYDFSGMTIMPGLINAHVHLGMRPLESDYEPQNDFELSCLIKNQLEMLLKSGVTYIRNQGTSDYFDLQAKHAVENKVCIGPEIMACGPAITIPNGHGSWIGLVCTGVDECIENVNKVINNGVGAVKIIATGGVMSKGTNLDTSQFSFEEMQAMVDIAKSHNKITSVHAHGATGMRISVNAGVDTVEHGTFMDDDIINGMLNNNTWLVPTLTAPHSIKTNGRNGGLPTHIMDKMDVVYDVRMQNFKKAYQAGVKIGLGTDGGTPFNTFDQTWFELKMLHDLGVPLMEALKIATINTAKMLRISEKYGSIDVNKYADFIILKDNPLEKGVNSLTNIHRVVKRGEMIKI